MMKLYTYFRSSAAYRVRIALNLKGLQAEAIPVHLVKDGGQHRAPEYLRRNPQGLVPMLELDGEVLTQSLAIIEYLEDVHPGHALLPVAPLARAQVRALALSIACDIHPILNLRVLKYLSGTLGVSDEQKNAWYRHWIEVGFAALEQSIAATTGSGEFSYGDTATMVDCCLIPQIYNAQRFAVDMAPYPTLTSINNHCLSLPEFSRAAPHNQPDAE